MKAIVQRVSQASVTVEGQIVGAINKGFLILLGVGVEDSVEDLEYLVAKISHLRVFSDREGKMNLDIKTIGGHCLIISQFTLFANTKKGNRPSFTESAPPEKAKVMYEEFCNQMSIKIGRQVQKGIFGADMKVSMINDGPVTIMFDTRQKS